MTPMVYTQEMRANHEICPYCGTWHTAMSCPPQFAITTLRILDLEEKVQSLTASRDAWKADAIRLAAALDGTPCCGGWIESIGNDIMHDIGCPIPLHQLLIEEEKVSDDLIVTLPRGDMYNINLIHLIEQTLNKALDPIGFTLTGTTKGKEVVLKFHQFGIAIDREEQP